MPGSRRRTWDGHGWYEVGTFLGPSIRNHYAEWPVSRLLQAWRDARIEDVSAKRLSLGGVTWGRKRKITSMVQASAEAQLAPLRKFCSTGHFRLGPCDTTSRSAPRSRALPHGIRLVWESPHSCLAMGVRGARALDELHGQAYGRTV